VLIFVKYEKVYLQFSADVEKFVRDLAQSPIAIKDAPTA
jgi:hypothetical protein